MFSKYNKFKSDNLSNLDTSNITSLETANITPNEELMSYDIVARQQQNNALNEPKKETDQITKIASDNKFIESLKSITKKDNNEIIDIINSRQDIDQGYKDYLIKLAKRESSFNPNADNKLGYTGLFQLGEAALKDIGITKDQYMKDVASQIDAVIKYTNKNKSRIQDLIDLGGVNLYGALGASHLGGAGGFRKYYTTKYNPKDVLGTSIDDYYKLFSV